MNILILGGGGREHALAWAFAQNPKVDRLWCAPGNPGIAEEATCVALDILDGDKIAGFCAENAIDFVMIGPEAPLAEGVADMLRATGIATLGPGREAARLEASKAFTKEICAACGAPTAASQTFTDPDAAHAFADAQGAPIVVKADGLAAGKGVTVAETVAEAHAALDAIFAEGPGARVVVEEFMTGEEASLFVLADGNGLPLPRHRPGPQARLRRRPRPDDRRHGRLLPGPGDDPRGHRSRPRPHRPPDARRDGPPRHPLPGRALRRPDDRGRRAPPRRVQRPLRRPRGPGARHAPRRPAPRRLPRRRHRRPRRRPRQLRRRPRDDRGDGGQRLSRRPRPRRADRPDRIRRPAGQGVPRRHPPRRRPPRLERRPRPQRHRPRRDARRGPRPSPTPRSTPSTGPAASPAATSAGARSRPADALS